MHSIAVSRSQPAPFVRPRFGLAGAALLTAIAVAAIALTGSRPESTAADADGEMTAEATAAPASPKTEQHPLVAR